MPRFTSALLLLGKLSSASADVESMEQIALELSDECQGDAGANQSHCAVNALQKQGTIIAATLEGGFDNVANAEEDATDLSLLSASAAARVANRWVRHYALNCNYHCNQNMGFCDWCGSGNACCQAGRGGQSVECSTVHFWPIYGFPTCVKPHYHVPAEPPQPAQPIPAGQENMKTLYQLTSPENAKSILASTYHAGAGGWCGGAIYLIDHPHLPKSKYNPHTTTDGAYVQLQVKMGKLCTMKRTCNDGHSGKCCTYPPTGGKGVVGAQNAGCNSISWNPGDGEEFIIWHHEQIVSKKLYRCYKEQCQNIFPDLHFDSNGIVQQ